MKTWESGGIAPPFFDLGTRWRCVVISETGIIFIVERGPIKLAPENVASK
jgi:hypothetical protein